MHVDSGRPGVMKKHMKVMTLQLMAETGPKNSSLELGPFTKTNQEPVSDPFIKQELGDELALRKKRQSNTLVVDPTSEKRSKIAAGATRKSSRIRDQEASSEINDLRRQLEVAKRQLAKPSKKSAASKNTPTKSTPSKKGETAEEREARLLHAQAFF
ncbi:hypothetical protein CTRI78_v006076 [Colletotrichum trifolii]|uniref:Uncharacterized protein n=1 Tax=Colletotrichum trifolii TaxID=5466 RepID=A0A4R8RHT8_COLTR|nr:hypothetical protein CTRI78_v006076 [Colletotrichum trifolii]